MNQRVDAQREQAAEVKILKIGRRRLHDHLKLVVVLQAIGVFAISTVSGTTAGLNNGLTDGLKEQRSRRQAADYVECQESNFRDVGKSRRVLEVVRKAQGAEIH